MKGISVVSSECAYACSSFICIMNYRMCSLFWVHLHAVHSTTLPVTWIVLCKLNGWQWCGWERV